MGSRLIIFVKFLELPIIFFIFSPKNYLLYSRLSGLEFGVRTLAWSKKRRVYNMSYSRCLCAEKSLKD